MTSAEFEIVVSEHADRQIRKLLKKGYHHILEDIEDFKQELKKAPLRGSTFQGKCRKIDWKSTDSGRGGRGGFRIITYPKTDLKIVTILTVTPKGNDAKMNHHDRLAFIEESLIKTDEDYENIRNQD